MLGWDAPTVPRCKVACVTKNACTWLLVRGDVVHRRHWAESGDSIAPVTSSNKPDVLVSAPT